MDQEQMMKDLKVRLPVHYHMKLQTLKILKGKNMSDSLCEALDLYFEERGIKLAPGVALEMLAAQETR